MDSEGEVVYKVGRIGRKTYRDNEKKYIFASLTLTKNWSL